MNWLAHYLGYGNPGGRWEAWWAGAGSDIGELAIIGGLATMIRHKNCEVHKCWRLGRHKTAAGHVVCRFHHPDDHLTGADVQVAHAVAKTKPSRRITS